MKKFNTLFISYPHAHAEIAREVRRYLVKKGYHVWMDEKDIAIKDNWRQKIYDGLMETNGVVSFLSKEAVNGICMDELNVAYDVRRVEIMTILLEKKEDIDPENLHEDLFDKQGLDMINWREKYNKIGWKKYFNSKMKELMSVLNSKEYLKFCEEINYLKESLRPYENDSKIQMLQNMPFVGRKWLMKEVHDWLNCQESSKVLMLYGTSGTGKSAFAANLKQFYRRNILTELFFEWDEEYLYNTKNIFRTLAFRIAAVRAEYRTALYQFLKREDKEYFRNASEKRLIEDLFYSLFEHNVKGEKSYRILLLDGLDETSDDVQKWIAELCKRLPYWIKILITSRGKEYIKVKFESSLSIDINSYEEANYEDMKEYVKLKMLGQHNSAISKYQKIEGQKENDVYDDVQLIVQKAGDNFQYATLLCDHLIHKNMHVEDIRHLPTGMNAFYLREFERMYPDKMDFYKDRPLLELLATEEILPLEIVLRCIGKEYDDDFETDIRCRLVGILLIGTKKKIKIDNYLSVKSFFVLEFTHKSIVDWITDRELSEKYYVNPVHGYEKLYSMDGNFMDEEVNAFCSNNKIKWMVKANKWNDLEEHLLHFIDSIEVLNNGRIAIGNQEDYNIHDFCLQAENIWIYADSFPKEYSVNRIIEKINNMTKKKSHIECNEKGASLEYSCIAFCILNIAMKTDRYANAIFSVFYNYIPNFETVIIGEDMNSIVEEYRYNLVVEASNCIKKCDVMHLRIPQNVANALNRLKLYSLQYYGSPNGSAVPMQVANTNASVEETEMWYKEICILNDDEEAERGFTACKELRKEYNTRRFLTYLLRSTDEDMIFVRTCSENLVNVLEACKYASKVLDEYLCMFSDEGKEYDSVKEKYNSRKEYILRIVKSYSTDINS